MEFVIPSVPVAQPRQRHRVVGKIVHSYTPVKHPVNAFKAAVGMAWFSSDDTATLTGPVCIDVVFVLPRPQSMTRKTKPNPRTHHAKKPDLDNLLKSLYDGLTACGAWRDDSQICECHAIKTYASADEAANVEVAINEIEQ